MNLLALAAANLAGIPFRLFSRRPFEAPAKVLILKPCCLSQVMLATPLLAVLSDAYPEARFDWAVSDWARPAISGNPRISQIVDTGQVTLGEGAWADVGNLVERLRQGEYDTCFVPSRSSLLSYISWRAGIRQRIGLNVNGQGFAYTLPVKPLEGEQNEAEIYLSLARAVGIQETAGMEFYPADQERESITGRLHDDVGWDGISPLVIVHPGGGENPENTNRAIRWPEERFALLCSRLIRKYGAHLVLVASKAEEGISQKILGLTSIPISNLAGALSLGEVGALCEVADLYVGNDTGPTHIAVAMGCPTLAIYGPTDPAVSRPNGDNRKVRIVQAKPETRSTNNFSWERGATVDEVLASADDLLGLPPDHLSPDP
jgi:ADP-heptose:LPS heptosyltransferase